MLECITESGKLFHKRVRIQPCTLVLTVINVKFNVPIDYTKKMSRQVYIVYINRNQKYFLAIVVTIARCINLLSFTNTCRSMLSLSSNNNKLDTKQTDLLEMLFTILALNLKVNSYTGADATW